MDAGVLKVDASLAEILEAFENAHPIATTLGHIEEQLGSWTRTLEFRRFHDSSLSPIPES